MTAFGRIRRLAALAQGRRDQEAISAFTSSPACERVKRSPRSLNLSWSAKAGHAVITEA